MNKKDDVITKCFKNKQLKVCSRTLVIYVADPSLDNTALERNSYFEFKDKNETTFLIFILLALEASFAFPKLYSQIFWGVYF